MDERTRKMIREYIPGDPDPSLDDEEYYFLQETSSGSRVIRVYALDILPHRDGTEYGIYQMKGGRLVWVDGGHGERERGVYFRYLYDNKEDCRNQTHWFMDDWQRLREIQRQDG